MRGILTEKRLLDLGKWGTLLFSIMLLIILQYQSFVAGQSFIELIQENLLMNILMMVVMVNLISFLELHVLLNRSHSENGETEFAVFATIWMAQAALMNFVVAVFLGYGILIHQRRGKESLRRRLKSIFLNKNRTWIAANGVLFIGMVTIIYTSLLVLF